MLRATAVLSSSKVEISAADDSLDGRTIARQVPQEGVHALQLLSAIAITRLIHAHSS